MEIASLSSKLSESTEKYLNLKKKVRQYQLHCKSKEVKYSERIAGLDRHCRDPGTKRRDRRSGPVPGPGRLEVIAEDAVHCTARAGVRVDTRALTWGRVAGLDRHRWAGATRLDASGRGLRRGRYRHGVIAGPTVPRERLAESLQKPKARFVAVMLKTHACLRNHVDLAKLHLKH